MPKYIKVATFNIHHAKGLDERLSLKRVAKTLQKLNAHIIGLQEVDNLIPRSYFQNQTKKLAQYLDMYYAFSPNLKFCCSGYGNAVLSKFPIIKSGHTLLPGKLEQRGLQYALLSLPGTESLHFYNTHLGLSTEDRTVQIISIVRHLPDKSKPVILTGDFNTATISPELQPLAKTLCATGGIDPPYTYPAGKPQHSIDSIYISHHWRVINITAVPTTASDHWPLVCTLNND